MLYIGQVDLRCFASSGQNGGAMPGTMWIVPDDGKEHWNAATRAQGRLEGLPWVVFTTPVEDFVRSWYGLVGRFGRALQQLDVVGNVEMARCPVNAVRADMDLLARVYGPSTHLYRRNPTTIPVCMDAFRLHVTMPADLPSVILVTADMMMEGVLEYYTRVLKHQEVEYTRTNMYGLLGVTREQIEASTERGDEFTSTVTIEQA